jgi:hypothetical protein
VLNKVARLVLLACALTACNAFDGELVEPAVDAGPISDGGLMDGATGGTGSNAGFGGQSGAGAGGQAGNFMPGDAGDECRPVAPDVETTCTQICPETCNGEDDDCDDNVDEGRADALCELENAVPVCVDGSCFVSDCKPGFRDCDDKMENGCEASDDDVRNCGLCGTVCSIPGAIAACVEEECTAIGCEGGLGDCGDDNPDCETALNTPVNCGGCGESCDGLPNATAESCETGECTATSCALGFGDCNDARDDGCEQAVNSIAHCTECGQSCDFVGSSNDDCDDYVCRSGPCDDGYGQCDGVRTNGCEPLNTIEDCGACNQPCGGEDLENIESASCETGACVPVCLEGFDDCDEQPFTGCETSIRTNDDCGACDEACTLDNASATCLTGSCEIGECDPGWLDCNDDPEDGCEKSSNDDDTCGGCDIECMPPDPVCAGGVCGDVICGAGTADCAQDGLPCEINLTNDEQHCGRCNSPCQFNAGITPHSAPLTCQATVCEVSCDAGWDDCNNDYRDGCETPLNTLTSCGSCGMACSIPNAGESCSTGQCLVTTCAADFRDCDGDRRSCERPVNTASDCGACNAACTLPNATPVCGGSPGSRSCGVGTCVQFFANCDGSPGNGCEVNLQTDTDDCGACNYDCEAEEHVATATCSGGSCNFSCDPNFRDCNGSDGDGCETSTLTLTNCGGCGVGCARSNGMASCASGTCELTGCNGGFDECDDNENNGCESLSTLANCGGCGNACLPPNASGTCATGSCQVSSCAAGWANCDNNPSNGCERNTTALGPCLPDTGCTRSVFGGNEYFYCPTARNWDAARARCNMQLYGDLVRIDSAAENSHVLSLIGTTMAAWFGGTDDPDFSVEGQWRWSNDTSQFWTGTAGGTAYMGAFAFWNSGEPNDSGANEDCAEILPMTGANAGRWNDQPCTTRTIPFVCEIAGDLCPADPMKTAPGQCGCGVADTDTDMDRTANCTDACPSDPAKVALGACGCGVADTDGDGDGTPNCNDMCPTNPAKVAPGMCGCGTADTDSDNDGTANCNDLCPSDPQRQAPPCAFPYAPTNYDPGMLNYVAAPVVNLDCSPTIDTSTLAVTGWCGGTTPTLVTRTQSGGPEVAVLATRDFTLVAGRTLRVIGSRPLIISINGNASILGNVNARGAGAQPGAGGNSACSAGAIGDNGGHDSGGDEGSAGGAGGAYVTPGGGGGDGNGGPGGAAASTVESTATLALRGGCQGGNGGGSGGGRQGGGGGGGIELSVAGTLTMSGAGARISTSGGAGARGSSDEDGGGGGGSGGMVLVEANALNITGGWVTANGGGAASGNATNAVNGANGSDGLDNGSGTTPGGAGQGDGGGGGGVGAGASAGAGSGGDGNTYFFFIGGAGGGGGGGGRGRIHYRGVTSCNLGGSSSPGATRAGVCQ